MTDLRTQVLITLEEAGYTSWLDQLDEVEIVGFEDEAVMGFACIFPSASALIEGWRMIEGRLLAKHARTLQRAGEKTWNVYCVFLAETEVNEEEARIVRWIEEDLERTRKLAVCGITDQRRLVDALLPLLPLQYQAALDREDFNIVHRLTRRIESIAPSISTVALDASVGTQEIVRLLGVDV